VVRQSDNQFPASKDNDYVAFQTIGILSDPHLANIGAARCACHRFRPLPEDARLKIAISDRENVRHEAIFPLTGLDRVRKKLGNACKWAPVQAKTSKNKAKVVAMIWARLIGVTSLVIGGAVCAQSVNENVTPLESCFRSSRLADEICTKQNGPAERLDCL
jgi:hypothetical protein